MRQLWRLPNLISLSRLLLTLPIYLLIAWPGRAHDALLYALLALAMFSDYLDGYVSRRPGQSTALGVVLDPLADKVIMACSLYALVRYRGLPADFFLFLLYRDLLILAFGAVLSLRSRKVYPALFWGKINTGMVSGACLSFLLLPGRLVTTVLLILGTATILVSGISYYRLGEPLLFKNPFVKWCVRLAVSALPLHFLARRFGVY
jgi:cardiolipin synthase